MYVHSNNDVKTPAALLHNGVGAFHIKVSKSQNKIIEPKLLPKTNGQICFSILTVWIYLKLAIETSIFKYFRTIRIEKQIPSLVFWEKLWLDNLLLKFTDL